MTEVFIICDGAEETELYVIFFFCQQADIQGQLKGERGEKVCVYAQ